MITRRHMLAATGGFAGLAAARAAAAQTPAVATQGRNGTMEITRSGFAAVPQGTGRNTSPARCASTRCSRRAIRHGSAAAASHSSRVPAPPGIRIRSVRHLIITAGLGWVQREGGPTEEVRPGDVVWFPPGLRHWHGATPTTAMTHIAIHGSAQRQECRLDGEGQRRAIPQMRPFAVAAALTR